MTLTWSFLGVGRERAWQNTSNSWKSKVLCVIMSKCMWGFVCKILSWLLLCSVSSSGHGHEKGLKSGTFHKCSQVGLSSLLPNRLVLIDFLIPAACRHPRLFYQHFTVISEWICGCNAAMNLIVEVKQANLRYQVSLKKCKKYFSESCRYFLLHFMLNTSQALCMPNFRQIQDVLLHQTGVSIQGSANVEISCESTLAGNWHVSSAMDIFTTTGSRNLRFALLNSRKSEITVNGINLSENKDLAVYTGRTR